MHSKIVKEFVNNLAEPLLRNHKEWIKGEQVLFSSSKVGEKENREAADLSGVVLWEDLPQVINRLRSMAGFKTYGMVQSN